MSIRVPKRLADIIVERLVVLFAKTGTGKTSLINAGIRPLLEERGYKTFIIRVQKEPVKSVKDAVARQLGSPLPPHDSFAADLEWLAEELGRPVVLFLDQFEEFFIYAARENPDEAWRFITDLGRIYNEEDFGVHVVLSMREEFFVELDMFRDEIPEIFSENSSLRLRWFDESQARDAIVRPAQRQGVTIEQKLVDALINDLSASGPMIPGLTPIRQIEPAQLQIVCDALWRIMRGNRLTLDQYRRLGKSPGSSNIAHQILNERLQQQFEQLHDKAHFELLKQILPQLRTDRGTKRIWDWLSLSESLRADEQTLREVVDQLAQSHVIRITSLEDVQLIELTHDYFVERLDELAEAVGTIWPRRLLRDAAARSQQDHASQAHRSLLDREELIDVLARAKDLNLSSLDGEILLRSAAYLREEPRSLTSLLRSGLNFKGVFRDLLVSASDGDEAWYLMQVLAVWGTAQAFELLEFALDHHDLAGRRLSLLIRRNSPSAAVRFLTKALRFEELVLEAEQALRILAQSDDQGIAEAAREALPRTLQHEVEEELEVKESRREEASSIRAARPEALTEPLRQHCSLVAHEMKSGRVVPFLGPGANLCGRPEEHIWKPLMFDWLPNGRELAEYLAKTFAYQGRHSDDLLKVSQYIKLVVGVFPLYTELRGIFDGDYRPTTLHRFVAEVPSILRHYRDPPQYQLIVTANYDDMLERAFRAVDEPFDLVAYDAEGENRGKFVHYLPDGEATTILHPDRYSGLALGERTIILKIYGTVNRQDESRDSFAITEDHYIDYLSKTDVFPVALVDKLRRSHCLFLGYGLQDWNLRVILNRMWGEAKLRSTSWAVQVSPDPLDELLWSNRDVAILNVTLEDYVVKLRTALLDALA